MKKRVIGLVSALVIVVGIVGAAPAPLAAASSGCDARITALYQSSGKVIVYGGYAQCGTKTLKSVAITLQRSEWNGWNTKKSWVYTAPSGSHYVGLTDHYSCTQSGTYLAVLNAKTTGIISDSVSATATAYFNC